MIAFPNYTAAQWEALLQMSWLYLTPPALTVAAIILFVRLVTDRRWQYRMSRASFLLVLSYALLMDRILLGLLSSNQTANAPDPAFAAFYLLAAIYFAYALLLEWVAPFMWRIYLWLRSGRRGERPSMEKGSEHA